MRYTVGRHQKAKDHFRPVAVRAYKKHIAKRRRIARGVEFRISFKTCFEFFRRRIGGIFESERSVRGLIRFRGVRQFDIGQTESRGIFSLPDSVRYL